MANFNEKYKTLHSKYLPEHLTLKTLLGFCMYYGKTYKFKLAKLFAQNPFFVTMH